MKKLYWLYIHKPFQKITLTLTFGFLLLSLAGCREKNYEFVVNNLTDYAIDEFSLCDGADVASIPPNGSSSILNLKIRKLPVRQEINIAVTKYSDLTANYTHTASGYALVGKFDKKKTNIIEIILKDNPVFPGSVFDVKLK